MKNIIIATLTLYVSIIEMNAQTLNALNPNEDKIYYRFIEAPSSNLHLDASDGNDLFLNHYHGNKIKFGNNGSWMTISSDKIGFGTNNPNIWFQSQVFELNYTRPVLSLKSSGTLGTFTFTNTSINTNHYGEFHINHFYSNEDPDKSTLTFNSYPGGTILTMQSGGCIGIGTETTGSHKLAVNGC